MKYIATAFNLSTPFYDQCALRRRAYPAINSRCIFLFTRHYRTFIDLTARRRTQSEYASGASATLSLNLYWCESLRAMAAISANTSSRCSGKTRVPSDVQLAVPAADGRANLHGRANRKSLASRTSRHLAGLMSIDGVHLIVLLYTG